MQLHILGCDGGYPCAEGATSGYLVERAGQALLMDCGAGVLGRLMARWDPAALAGVLLSHLHADHASDLLVLGYYLEKMGKRLAVYVPPEDRSPLRAMLPETAFQVLPYPAALSLMGLEIRNFPGVHPVPCRALRLTDGSRTLCYTGDTNLCPGLDAFCAGADVLLADSALLSSEWTENSAHMSAAAAAQLAVKAACKRLYLTHLPASHAPETLEQEARALLPAALAVRPGMVISL